MGRRLRQVRKRAYTLANIDIDKYECVNLGLPHYGHLLAGTIKDVVTRWAHQNGHYVERRFGWDTHGLYVSLPNCIRTLNARSCRPVEHEIDKKLGIRGPDDVAAMGIEAYNRECRAIVMRYSGEWRTTVERIGRWIDFDNDYKTLYPSFMESVWWVFSELYKKDLVYRGVKVMPYSTGCSTPLSNFESNLNYKDVVDPGGAFFALYLQVRRQIALCLFQRTSLLSSSRSRIAISSPTQRRRGHCRATCR